MSAAFSVDTDAMTIDEKTVVYISSNDDRYHLTNDCEEVTSPKGTALETALSDGRKMCEVCAKNEGLDPDDAAKLTIGDLPFDTKSNSTTKSNSSASDSSNDDVESDSKSTTSKSTTSKTTTSKTTTSKSSSSSSGSSSGELMTERQRKNKFYSKTNPKRGEKPVTVPRPSSAGFRYADFATYNSYNSENKLGGTPVYLLGTIMDIQPVKQSGSVYSLAVLVNDCDGYQWYMRCSCSKDKYDLLKAEMLGKAAYIYGIYSGYSGVTNRPMLDINSVFEVGGNIVSIALYQ